MDRIISVAIPLLLLLGGTTAFLVRENVIFEEIKQISTSKSHWTITFIIELTAYDSFIHNVSRLLNETDIAAETVIKYYANATKSNKNDQLHIPKAKAYQSSIIDLRHIM